MLSQTQISRFTVGQRVKVVVLLDDGELVDHLPTSYLKYNDKIGYITDFEEMCVANGKKEEKRYCRYEVLVTKVGVTLELPEDCLELAEYRRFS